MRYAWTVALAVLVSGCGSNASDKQETEQAGAVSATSKPADANDTAQDVRLHDVKMTRADKADEAVSRLTEADVQARYTKEFEVCMNSGEAAQGITVGIMDCLGLENDAQDRRLNAIYKEVMGSLDQAGKSDLRDLQRQWIKDRDATCHKASDEEGGGSLSAIILSGCFLDETVKRTVWLETYKS